MPINKSAVAKKGISLFAPVGTFFAGYGLTKYFADQAKDKCLEKLAPLVDVGADVLHLNLKQFYMHINLTIADVVGNKTVEVIEALPNQLANTCYEISEIYGLNQTILLTLIAGIISWQLYHSVGNSNNSDGYRPIDNTDEESAPLTANCK